MDIGGRKIEKPVIPARAGSISQEKIYFNSYAFRSNPGRSSSTGSTGEFSAYYLEETAFNPVFIIK
ncbi:MAG: hypothetical protein DRP51_02275 [Candidatus Zixiibacteriota bacterium]|nr:MAG: hypothetical protein DRP51_02275 [candidate division Zixibacteria bacterium]